MNSPHYYARWRKLHSFKVHNSHIWLPHAHAHQKWSVWWNVIFDSNVLNIVAATLLIRGIQNLPYWISLPKCPPRQIWSVRNKFSTQQKKLGGWSTSNTRTQGIRITCFFLLSTKYHCVYCTAPKKSSLLCQMAKTALNMASTHGSPLHMLIKNGEGCNRVDVARKM